MRKIIKYTSLWAFFWLASYMFAQQFSSLTIMDTFTKYFQGVLVLYMLYFVTYTILFVSNRVDARKQKILERILYLMMLGITIGYGTYIFSNPWLYGSETTISAIIVEVQGVSGFIITTFIALIAGLDEDSTMLITKGAPLWNTYKTYDEVFLIGMGILFIVLVLFNSKAIPGIRRDYWQLARTIFTVIGVVSLWSHTRLYTTQRTFFYTAIAGLLVSTIWEASLFIFFKKATLIELLGETTMNLTVSSTVYIITILFLATWLCWCIGKERMSKEY